MEERESEVSACDAMGMSLVEMGPVDAVDYSAMDVAYDQPSLPGANASGINGLKRATITTRTKRSLSGSSSSVGSGYGSAATVIAKKTSAASRDKTSPRNSGIGFGVGIQPQ